MEKYIYNCFNTVLELLKDRDFEIPKVYSNMTLSNFNILYHNSKSSLDINLTNAYSSIYVKFLFSVNSIENINDIHKGILEKGYSKTIMIICDEDWTETKINELNNVYIPQCSLFFYKYISFNYTKNKLVPKHSKCSDMEKEEILNSLNITESSIPILNITDPVSKYYGFGMNTLVKISRNVNNNSLITYRIVKYVNTKSEIKDSDTGNNISDNIDDDELDMISNELTLDTDYDADISDTELNLIRNKYKDDERRRNQEALKKRMILRDKQNKMNHERQLEKKDISDYSTKFKGELGNGVVLSKKFAGRESVPIMLAQNINFNGRGNELKDYFFIGPDTIDKIQDNNLVFDKDNPILDICTLQRVELLPIIDKQYNDLLNIKFILIEDKKCDDIVKHIKEVLKLDSKSNLLKFSIQSNIIKYLNSRFSTFEKYVSEKRNNICLLNSSTLTNYNIYKDAEVSEVAEVGAEVAEVGAEVGADENYPGSPSVPVPKGLDIHGLKLYPDASTPQPLKRHPSSATTPPPTLDPLVVVGMNKKMGGTDGQTKIVSNDEGIVGKVTQLEQEAEIGSIVEEMVDRVSEEEVSEEEMGEEEMTEEEFLQRIEILTLLEDTPSFLVFTKSRLQYISRTKFKKLGTTINLPTELSIVDRNGEEVKYNFASLSYHSGDAYGGHYVNVVKLTDNNYYYISDNSKIRRLTQEDELVIPDTNYMNNWTIAAYVREGESFNNFGIGINNPSNYCFINSALQIIFSIKKIKKMIELNSDYLILRNLNRMSIIDIKKSYSSIFSSDQKLIDDKPRLIDIILNSKQYAVFIDLRKIYSIINNRESITKGSVIKNSLHYSLPVFKTIRKNLVNNTLGHEDMEGVTEDYIKPSDNAEFIEKILQFLSELNIINDKIYVTEYTLLPSLQ